MARTRKAQPTETNTPNETQTTGNCYKQTVLQKSYHDPKTKKLQINCLFTIRWPWKRSWPWKG